MSNSLAVNDVKFTVSYVPSVITIQNEPYLENLVDQIVKDYGSLVFTEDNIPEAKKTRTELNGYAKTLDDERKRVKKEYSQPLKDFEAKINKMTKKINSISDEIKKGIDDYDLKQIEIRKKIVNTLIDEMLVSHNLVQEDLKDFEFDKSWLNQTSFNKKGEPVKKVIEGIHGKLAYISLQNQQKADAKKAVREFAELSGLEPYAWEDLIDQGFSSADVITRIRLAVENKKRDEAEKERQRLARQEYEEAMAKLAEQQQTQVNGKVIDSETGEIQKEAEPVNQLITTVLEITGDYESLSKLKKFMDQNNLSYRKAGN